MKHIRFLAAAFVAAAGAAQAAPVVELPQDAPRVFIRTAEAGPVIELPYQGAAAAQMVAVAQAPAAVAKVEAPAAAATASVVAVAGTAGTAGTR